ncbi:ankyrin-3-like [Mya arenaria]|uniref:ankyrin-3-like n=1 Tax=Mya arenaria TaxID=6604 RepID=UPI0022E256CF|nr:ankyrin-3-like [Mya arenaria]XP_052783653.1 ankyrin-3-like [Mya arenaria]XP_052783654.1 ankyrin-3-like [Mya arenaria]
MGKSMSRTVYIESENNAQLFTAIEKGQLHVVKRIVKISDSTVLYTARQKGKSLLHCAVLNGQIEALKYLLDAGLDANTKDDFGDAALLEVAHCSSWIDLKVVEAIIKLLIGAKADINATSNIGRTCLLKCIVEYRLATAEKLLTFRANPNLCDTDGLYPIHVCATYKLLPLLKKLVAFKANIDAQDIKGRTALYLSVNAGHQEIPTELIKYGCNVNLGSSFGYPLSAAITKCRPDMVKLLLEHGANVQIKLNEQRQVFLKGYDCLNLALIVLHIHSAIADMTHYTEEPRIENLKAAIRILDLIIQSMGKPVVFNKNIFFRSRKPDLSSDITLLPIDRQLKAIYQRLVFVYEMTKAYGKPALEGMPPLNPSIDKRSLQNICRMKMRQYLLESGSNVLCSIERVDCPQTVKDVLLLKDISWC